VAAHRLPSEKHEGDGESPQREPEGRAVGKPELLEPVRQRVARLRPRVAGERTERAQPVGPVAPHGKSRHCGNGGCEAGVPDPTRLREPAQVQGRWFEGESLSGVAERAWREVLSLVAQHCGKHVAIVTHGGVMQLALTRAKGLPATEWRTFRIPNVSQVALEFQPDGAVVVLPGW